MKKLLLVLAIAGFAVACNNKKSDENKATTDTTKTTMDTTSKMAPDTTAKMAPTDTTKK